MPFNHEILREANALCHRLPVLSTSKFKTDFYDVSKLCVPSYSKYFQTPDCMMFLSDVSQRLRLVLTVTWPVASHLFIPTENRSQIYVCLGDYFQLRIVTLSMSHSASSVVHSCVCSSVATTVEACGADYQDISAFEYTDSRMLVGYIYWWLTDNKKSIEYCLQCLTEQYIMFSL